MYMLIYTYNGIYADLQHTSVYTFTQDDYSEYKKKYFGLIMKTLFVHYANLSSTL